MALLKIAGQTLSDIKEVPFKLEKGIAVYYGG